MKKKIGKIGVFDSGFGGLSILKVIEKVLPDYEYIYLGDTARTPYGTRSKEVVYQFTLQAVEFLFKQDCEIIIIACNTASADALRRIQQEYVATHFPNRRVLGVLVPAAEEAVARTKNKRIGVLATAGTVRSDAFLQEIQKLDPKTKVFQKPAPLLVPLVEEGEHRSKAAELILRTYVKRLLEKKVDTIILGCTHYGYLESVIRKIVGKNVRVISEGKIVARKFADYLERHPEIQNKLSRKTKITFYTTDITEQFQRLGSSFFGRPIKPVLTQLG